MAQAALDFRTRSPGTNKHVLRLSEELKKRTWTSLRCQDIAQLIKSNVSISNCLCGIIKRRPSPAPLLCEMDRCGWERRNKATRPFYCPGLDRERPERPQRPARCVLFVAVWSRGVCRGLSAAVTEALPQAAFIRRNTLSGLSQLKQNTPTSCHLLRSDIIVSAQSFSTFFVVNCELCHRKRSRVRRMRWRRRIKQ